jgi:alpha/beta superfamily hydrolase
MAKKKKVDFAVDVPKDFNGEVSISRSKAIPEVILPIAQHFGHGDLNILRDKINEIIAKR